MTQETKTAGATSTVTTYTWDDKGNLSTKTADGQVTVYGWNADNRLVEVKQGSSQALAATVARYSYDANGNRVQKSEPGQNTSPDKVTNYLVDDTFEYAQTVQETTLRGATTESTSYVWGNGLIQQSRAGQLNYYHADALDSTKVLTDLNGNVTDAYQYDAYGVVLNKTGVTANSYRYAGEYFDDASSLQYNRARWYDAASGRFISMDSFGGFEHKPVSINKYTYADDQPTNGNDPSGAFVNTSEEEEVLAEQGVIKTISGPALSIGQMASTQLSRAVSSANSTLTNVGTLTILADMCKRNPQNCWLDVPVYALGGAQMPETVWHIISAQMGFGSNEKAISPGVNGYHEQSRSFLNKICTKPVRREFETRTGAPGVCDEYPFNSNRQGGKKNFVKGNVSLRMVPAGEQSIQGGQLSHFYNGFAKIARDGYSKNSMFIALGIPGTRSFAINRDRKVHIW